MSLLQLSPEANRLRRIAKACAAGELTRLEYREARRAMIDKFVCGQERHSEDTQPRFDLDITQRRPAVAIGDDEQAASPNWMLWTAVVLLLAALALLPMTVLAADIPPVAERDPNPATAPRYDVAQVRVTGLEEEIDEAEVATFVAARLSELKAENATLDHGFNAAELEEVARYLKAIGLHDEDTRLNLRDLEDLQALVAAQKRRRGVSLVQLEALAGLLQVWVREQGYPLARAYVPAQSVDGTDVTLGVSLGRISAITVSGEQGGAIEERFAELLGSVVSRDAVETRLNLFNRTRGMRAQAGFVPGSEVGTTEMVLDLQQYQRFAGFIQLDNHGVEPLGEERVTLQGQWNSPRGVGDVLSAKAFSSVDPADHQYLEVGYLTPIMNGRFESHATLRWADLRLDEYDVEGDGLLFDAKLTDTRQFTRTKRREYSYGVGLHDLDWDFVDGQRAWFVHAGADGHRLWDAERVAAEASLQALVGGVDDERFGQDGEFWRVRAALDAWRPVSLPWIDTRAKLTLGGRWQLADDALPPTLRLAGTGPQTNRGFEHGEALLDQGVNLQATLRFAAPRGDWWLFVDGIYGERNDTDAWTRLTSVGLGWEAQLLDDGHGSLVTRLTVGYPVAHESSGGFEDDGTQIYWMLRYAH